MVWRFECASHSEKHISCDWPSGLSDSSQRLWGRGQKKWGCLLCFGFCLGWWFGIWVSLKHCIAEVELEISLSHLQRARVAGVRCYPWLVYLFVFLIVDKPPFAVGDTETHHNAPACPWSPT